MPDINLQDIDLVMFFVIKRGQSEPATAHTMQHKLGLNARYEFDISDACFGFVGAMPVATNYIRCGISKRALIVTGEVPIRVLRAAVDMLNGGVDIKTSRNIICALSAGDAGGFCCYGPDREW